MPLSGISPLNLHLECPHQELLKKALITNYNSICLSVQIDAIDSVLWVFFPFKTF